LCTARTSARRLENTDAVGPSARGASREWDAVTRRRDGKGEESHPPASGIRRRPCGRGAGPKG
jgi:hypothetical protein